MQSVPAHDDAAIFVRSEGRQIVISTGGQPEADDLDISPDHVNQGTPTSEADGVDSTPQRKAGDITGFSDDARRRLRERVHSMRRDAECLFLTLTYHEVCPTPETAKRDLDLFFQALRRRFPDLSAIWKMEPQERGFPHFHVLVYGVEFIPVQKLSSLWHSITAERSEQHAKSGVDLERAVNQDGKLQSYFAKYMDEAYDTWPEFGGRERLGWDQPGRWWGVIGRENLPWATWNESRIYLHDHEARTLISRLLDRWGVDLPEGVELPSLTVNTYGDPLDEVDEYLEALL